MTSAVVDASVWVSRLLPQDVHHSACVGWLERFFLDGGIVVAPSLLLAEVAGPIARRTDDSRLAEAAFESIVRLPGLRLVPLNRRLSLAAAKLAAQHRLRGADAVYVALAEVLSVPLVTLDAEQRTRARSVVTVVAPGV